MTGRAMSRLRFSETVPSLPERDARLLRGLPSSWEEPIRESELDALLKRARAMAAASSAAGRAHEAREMWRRISLLERADDLHAHAFDVETLAQLYRALATLAEPGAPDVADASRTWLQAGALPGAPSPAHGPAFRETAALRSRAYRWLLALVARAGAAAGRRRATSYRSSPGRRP